MWYLPVPLAVAVLLLTFIAQLVAAEDVLLRSDELWKTLESIHRRGVDRRIGEVVDKGSFDTSVTLGYSPKFNWVDVWGPTYTCPTMEHFGTVGDGGKWVCGVETMLQRENCVIYSFGSKKDFSFEKEMVERTKCEIHVFDPTVRPSVMRQREHLLNGNGPTRVKWHSVGLHKVDEDSALWLPKCYGGFDVLYKPGTQVGRKALSANDRTLTGGDQRPTTRRLWRPPEDSQLLQVTSSDAATSQHQADPIQETAVQVTTEAGQEAHEAAPEQVPVYTGRSARDSAVQGVIQKLQEERVRINSAADACGVHAHKVGGIAPLPQGGVEAGNTIDLSDPPHGDSRTKCRFATLPTLMKSLGHEWIDVLKADIEGAEYPTLAYLDNLPGDAMRFTQLQLELHHPSTPDRSQPNVGGFTALHSLLRHGYRTTFLEPNIYFAAQACHELAFIKMDDCGNVVTPALTS